MNTYHQKRILGALDCEHELTAWEWDFINSLSDKGDEYDLSTKQKEILRRISEKTGR